MRDALDDIARAVRLIADRFKAGGRLIYVGAGTSARLAVADAAEFCRPPYGIDPERLPVVIAGGGRYSGLRDGGGLWRRCGRELKRLGLAATDIVLSLTASGTGSSQPPSVSPAARARTVALPATQCSSGGRQDHRPHGAGRVAGSTRESSHGAAWW